MVCRDRAFQASLALGGITESTLAARKQFMRQIGSLIAVFLLLDAMAFATIFGTVRGIVHDPQHRPIQGAHITLKAQNSDFTQSEDSNSNGEFDFSSVPIGVYTVTVCRTVSRRCARR